MTFQWYAFAQDQDWEYTADELVERARAKAKFRQFDSAIILYDSANKIYIREKLMAEYYLTEINKVHSLYGKGQLAEAFQLLETVREESADIKGKNIHFEVYRNKAILFENQRDFKSALETTIWPSNILKTTGKSEPQSDWRLCILEKVFPTETAEGCTRRSNNGKLPIKCFDFPWST